MPNCPRNCGDCKHCVAAHAQLVIDEKDAENAKLRAEKSQALLDCAELAMLRDKLNLQNYEYKTALDEIATLGIELGCGCESMQRTAQRALAQNPKSEACIGCLSEGQPHNEYCRLCE